MESFGSISAKEEGLATCTFLGTGGVKVASTPEIKTFSVVVTVISPALPLLEVVVTN